MMIQEKEAKAAGKFRGFRVEILCNALEDLDLLLPRLGKNLEAFDQTFFGTVFLNYWGTTLSFHGKFSRKGSDAPSNWEGTIFFDQLNHLFFNLSMGRGQHLGPKVAKRPQLF